MTATPTTPKALIPIPITLLAALVSVGSSASPVCEATAPELLSSEAEAESVSSASDPDEVEVDEAPTVPVRVVIWPALVTDPAVTVTGKYCTLAVVVSTPGKFASGPPTLLLHTARDLETVHSAVRWLDRDYILARESNKNRQNGRKEGKEGRRTKNRHNPSYKS